VIFSGLTLDLDVTAFVVVALIILPFLILNGLVFKPFIELFEKRHDRIEGAVERADAKLEEAERKATEFQSQLEATKRKGLQHRNSIRAAAQSAMSQKIALEQVTVEERVSEALLEITRAKDSAMVTVNTEAHRLAEATASKLLGRRV
jgi:F-type H+-transporting ATPase subunit b